MGELYERLLGQHPALPKVPVDPFSAAVYLRARAAITQQQMQDVIEHESGVPLGATALQEVADLLATVTGSPAAQLERIHVIEYIIHLADTGTTPHFDTPAKLRALLGNLPAR